MHPGDAYRLEKARFGCVRAQHILRWYHYREIVPVCGQNLQFRRENLAFIAMVIGARTFLSHAARN